MKGLLKEKRDLFIMYIFFLTVVGIAIENMVLMIIYNVYNLMVVYITIFATLISAQITVVFKYLKRILPP